MGNDQFIRRALAAYYRTEGTHAPAPSEDLSCVEVIDGRGYVALRDATGLLKVYRIRYDGVLQALKQGPGPLRQNRQTRPGFDALAGIRFGFPSASV